MILAIMINISIILWATWFRFRDVFKEAHEARRAIKTNELSEAKAELIKKLEYPRKYVNRHGDLRAVEYENGQWKYTRSNQRVHMGYTQKRPPTSTTVKR